MTHTEKIAVKNGLKKFALDLIEQRIAVSRLAIDQAQQAANQEEKSSAGDKYETGRAMGHLQKDMYARQLSENRKELASLHAINVDNIYEAAAAGALVECAGVHFFIAAGLGKHITGGRTVFFLSPDAPLAKQLQHKKAGDPFLFNGLSTTILRVY
ncbi:MAG TPA: hypothetical protein VK563_20310 [Puia sp.]|nr:hypothetical protein [Puia sp.]